MNFTSNQQILICIIIAIIIIFLFYNRSEDFVTNTEAINNLASLYNSSNLTATNINATGNINATTIQTPTHININPDGVINAAGFVCGKSVLGVSTNSSNAAPNSGDISWGDGSGWRLNLGKSGSPTMQIYDNGGVNVTNSVHVGNNVRAGDHMKAGDIYIGKSALGGSPNMGDISWGDGSSWRLNMGKSGSPTMQIDDKGGVNITYKLDLAGGQVPPTYVDTTTPQGWGHFANTAVTKFRQIDPIGTIKKIIFINGGGYDITFIKDTATTIRATSPGGWHGTDTIRTITNP
jgi:hypothetical protein